MPENPADPAPDSRAAHQEPPPDPTIWDPEVERLDDAECWRLIPADGVGRLAYDGQFGLTVLPVRYQVDQGSLVFRIALGSPTDEDLRTGIRGAEYRVAVEIDAVGTDAPDDWFVLIQGDAHHVDPGAQDESAAERGVEPPAGAEHFVRITPALMTGRRLRRR
jgi:hypothetical protein